MVRHLLGALKTRQSNRLVFPSPHNSTTRLNLLMKNKKFEVVSAAAIAWMAVSPANAELFIYEPFAYDSTGTDGDGFYLGDGSQSGALGLDGSWSQVINNIEMEVLEGGLDFTDTEGNVLTVAGNSILRSSRSGTAVMASAVTADAISGLTGDNTTMWMSFLFVDNGYSGPDSSVTLASESLASSNNHSLATAGYGVGIVIGEPSGGVVATVDTGYYLNTTSPTVAHSDLYPNEMETTVLLLAAKINWKPDGTPDEIYVFNITDMSAEPDEADAIASDSFDMPLSAQLALDTLNIGETQVDGFDEIRFGTSFADVVPATLAGSSVPTLVITRNGGNYDFSWNSSSGVQYDLLSSTDLDTAPSTWAVYDDGNGPYEAIAASGTGTNTLSAIVGSGDVRFFALRATELPAATILSADFEADNGDFTSINNGTGSEWEWGTPDSVGWLSQVVDSGSSSSNCWGTSLGDYSNDSAENGQYLVDTSTSLRSPVIDLTGYTTEVTLSFDENMDVYSEDTAEVYVIDSITDTVIGSGPIHTSVDPNSLGTGWTTVTDVAFPAEALGQAVRIEFRFTGSGGSSNDFMGWYIDNVVVEGR